MLITADKKRKTGIYCHIPFCVKKCAYCDFNSWACQDEILIGQYFQALKKEILAFAKNKKLGVDTIYFGGGTPSVVAAAHIKDLMDLLRQQFDLSRSAEITIELNPATATEEKLAIYQEAGINRVSVGLQAWQNPLLKVLGRSHDQQDFIRTMEELKKAAFTNISVDLMYGIPGQTIIMLEESLQAVTLLNPQHFSCYSLILEADTPLSRQVEQGSLKLPPEEEERRMHWLISEYLENKGFNHYEISSYAKPGYQSQHNLKYWEMSPYLGFGLGAHGFYQGVRYGNEDDYEKYVNLLAQGKGVSRREAPLTRKEEMNEWMFLGLRKLAGLEQEEFRNLFGEDFFEVYREELERLIDQNLLVKEKNRIRLTKHGQNFANQVFQVFI